MSRRGQITIECDSCEGESIFGHDDFDGATLNARMVSEEWTEHGTGKDRKDLCGTCREEIENGTRCDRCWTKLDPGYICGDCSGGTERDPQARSLETAAFPFAGNH